MSETTRGTEQMPPGTPYLAFELANAKWKLEFTTGLGQIPRQRTFGARQVEALQEEISAAQKRLDLPETAPVKSCYEAGRDGSGCIATWQPEGSRT